MDSIPKIIHYCWFGGKAKPELTLRCIESWKKHMPDYTLMEWNESNYDVRSNRFIQEAYDTHKWAFVTDVVRLHALYKHGGIYMDTDMEVIRGLDEFLVHEAFLGFENPYCLSAGIMGSSKENEWFGYLLSYYDSRRFIDENGKLDTTPNTAIITEMSKDYGFTPNNKFQILYNGVHVYASEYFSPKNLITRKVNLSPNTYCIHHFSASWMTPYQKVRTYILSHISEFIGKGNYQKVTRLLKNKGSSKTKTP